MRLSSGYHQHTLSRDLFLSGIWSSPVVIDSLSAMQVISLLSMEVAVVESRVGLIRWESAKELGQEGKSPLLSLRFNSS